MIENYGWSSALQNVFAPFEAQSLTPARVIASYRSAWRIVSAQGEMAARLSGRYADRARPSEYPVVGDWVAVRSRDAHATIHAVLPRESSIARRAAGGAGVQVVASNIDIALVVTGLGQDLNLRRIERYLVTTREGGSTPLIVITKADLWDDSGSAIDAVSAIAGGARVLAVSAIRGDGMVALCGALAPGVTAALVGSSGAGKSTLLNALAGRHVMETRAVRAHDERGVHTTTHRELFRLPWGALVIDTPGMRELGLIAGEEALDASFDDVAELIGSCRFHDCGHSTEPGCAVRAALSSGALAQERWQGYRKLQREIAFQQRREDPEAAAENRQRWKRMHRDARARTKHKRRSDD